MTKDFIDTLLEDWEREAPDLDVSGMAIIGRVIQLGRKLEQRIQTKLKPFNLNYTDFDLLATLRRSGGEYCLTPTELRRTVILTSGAMTSALDRLETMALIVRLRASADRRSMSAKLTPAGLALVEKLLPLRFKDANDLVSLLAKSQSQTTANALRRMLLACDEEADVVLSATP